MSDLHSLLLVGVAIVAFLYSSVGHGGASGYLAVLSLFSMATPEMGTGALLLNCLVAGLAFFAFLRAGYFSFRLTWPFLLASIPASFVGGGLSMSIPFYKILLAVTLTFAAFRLSLQTPQNHHAVYRYSPPLGIALPAGGGIGLLSGMVGIGGGIFLSPLLLLKGWGDPKKVAATSSLFILVNSVAGLVGRWFSGTFAVKTSLPLVLAAFLGGLIGSHLGANHFSGLVLRRLLALVLVIAVFKLIVTGTVPLLFSEFLARGLSLPEII